MRSNNLEFVESRLSVRRHNPRPGNPSTLKKQYFLKMSLSLPNELVEIILSFLVKDNYIDLVKFATICKQWKDISDKSLLWFSCDLTYRAGKEYVSSRHVKHYYLKSTYDRRSLSPLPALSIDPLDIFDIGYRVTQLQVIPKTPRHACSLRDWFIRRLVYHKQLWTWYSKWMPVLEYSFWVTTYSRAALRVLGVVGLASIVSKTFWKKYFTPEFIDEIILIATPISFAIVPVDVILSIISFYTRFRSTKDLDAKVSFSTGTIKEYFSLDSPFDMLITLAIALNSLSNIPPSFFKRNKLIIFSRTIVIFFTLILIVFSLMYRGYRQRLHLKHN